jgi:hypothetical protein
MYNYVYCQTNSIKIKCLLFFFLAAMVLLIISTIFSMRDFCDSWILEGIFPYYFLFVLAYSILVGFSNDLKLVTIVSSAFLVVINLIPSLKYSFIYGNYDPIGHYGFINEITKSGHVPNWGVYGKDYGSTPGLHTLVSAISILTGLDISASMKVFLVSAPIIIPMILYFVVRKPNMPRGLSKFIVISTVLTSPSTYVFFGTTSTYFLYTFFFSFLILFYLYNKFDRRYLLIGMVIGFAILFSHMATSMTLVVILAMSLLAQIIIKSLSRQKIFTLFLMTSYLSYLLFGIAGFDLANFVRLGLDLIGPLTGKGVPFVSYYGGFFKLTFYDQVKVLMVRAGSYVVTGMLCLLSVPISLKLRSRNSKLIKLYYVLILFSFVPASMFVLSARGFNVKDRFWCYFSAFSPFLAGITLWHSFHHRKTRFLTIKRFIVGIVVFVLICASSLQVLRFQLLVPKLSTEYGEKYVVNYHDYASFSQRSFVFFIAKYNNQSTMSTTGRIRWLIYGLTPKSFQALLTSEIESDLSLYGRPIASMVLVSTYNLDSSITSLNVMNYVRKASAYVNVTYAIIYTNGESYCFYNP